MDRDLTLDSKTDYGEINLSSSHQMAKYAISDQTEWNGDFYIAKDGRTRNVVYKEALKIIWVFLYV